MTHRTANSREDHTRSAVITAAYPLPGVRAGSALVRVGPRLMLAQDDEYALVWLHCNGDVQPEFLPLRPQTGAMPKSHKPDFEAATTLPDGRILIIGSGSAEPRRAVVLLDPVADTFEIRDAGRIYDLVEAEIGHELNIEGVVSRTGGLRLFHRGNSGGGNVTIDLEVDPDDTSGARVTDFVRWDIGMVPGAEHDVPLTFTDAHGDDAGHQWYLAAAEDTPDAIDDGPVVGSAIGRIGTQDGHWSLIIDTDGHTSVRKAEGLVVDHGAHAAWMVTDPDDEHAEAELCRVRLSGWS